MTPIDFAIRSPLTFSSPALICEPFRCCSAMPRLARRQSIYGLVVSSSEASRAPSML